MTAKLILRQPTDEEQANTPPAPALKLVPSTESPGPLADTLRPTVEQMAHNVVEMARDYQAKFTQQQGAPPPEITKYLAIDDLLKIPSPYNPRTINERRFSALRWSIRVFGPLVPVVVNTRYNRIVGGHQRVKAAKAEKLDAFPCIFVDLDEAAEMALNVALNEITGEFVDTELQPVLLRLRKESYSLEKLGFSDDRLKHVTDGGTIDIGDTGDGAGFASGAQFTKGGTHILIKITEQQWADVELKERVRAFCEGEGFDWKIKTSGGA